LLNWCERKTHGNENISDRKRITGSLLRVVAIKTSELVLQREKRAWFGGGVLVVGLCYQQRHEIQEKSFGWTENFNVRERGFEMKKTYRPWGSVHHTESVGREDKREIPD